MGRSGVWLVSALVTAGSLGLMPQDGSAQDTLPEEGSWSVLFGLPAGGASTFGIWRMISSRLNLGFDVEFDYEDTETEVFGGSGLSDVITDVQWSLRAGPQIKWYFPVGRSVVPYARTGLLAGVASRDADSPAASRDVNQFSLLLRTGIGVEWFPVDWVSFGGFTGLLFSYDDFTDEANGDPLVESTRWGLRTFHSGLGIQIYF